ncbi:MAG: DMT family transporter [Gammaproteobacteria bacterium]|nr:DMT family transporter [Gammaproteobacteria bacterium]
MKSADIARFLALAVLFSLSFLFMRVASPQFGALVTTELRVLIAGLALTGVVLATRRPLLLREHWRGFLAVGALNAGIPFALFAYAALHIPTGYSAILNSLMPIFAATFSAFMLDEKLTWRVFVGAAVGAAGAALLVQRGPVEVHTEVLLGALACVLAITCYGFSAAYTKKYLAGLPAHGAAASTLLLAAVLLAPLAAVSLPATVPSLKAWLAVSGLAIFSTALAFILYYQLMQAAGATQVAAVTFLLPAFGMLWGWIFLGEPITLAMIAGFLLAASAAGLVLAIGPFRRRS